MLQDVASFYQLCKYKVQKTLLYNCKIQINNEAELFFLQQSVTIPSLQSLTCATNALPKSIHQTSEMWKIIP